MISLRPFRPSDLQTAFLLDQRCFPAGIAYTRRELQHFLTAPSAFSLIAEIAGKPVATMAGFLVADRSGRNDAAHIVTIDVAPALRRQGVATLLMNAVEAHCSQSGCPAISLEVAVDNVAAMNFYQGRGFAVTAVCPGYYNGRLDAYSMEKTLSAP